MKLTSQAILIIFINRQPDESALLEILNMLNIGLYYYLHRIFPNVFNALYNLKSKLEDDYYTLT